jgi:isoleucyl-tRNA synthetase
MNKKSIHLQNFPDVSSLPDEKDLTTNMDMVRDICSAALFIRDSQNLRVRLPLNKLTIIGKNAEKMLDFKDIIADEVNVKNIEIICEIGDLAEIKLQINFKKVGAKLGSKMKQITAAAKENNWEKMPNGKIKIANEILDNDEFEIKLITKNPQNTAALPSNDCLVELDTIITKKLEEEGLARDIVRAIGQNRKDANLDISSHIKITISSNHPEILSAVRNHKNYICQQTLSNEILTSQNLSDISNCKHRFENKIETRELSIGFDVL